VKDIASPYIEKHNDFAKYAGDCSKCCWFVLQHGLDPIVAIFVPESQPIIAALYYCEAIPW
jgi:hypothetical protein